MIVIRKASMHILVTGATGFIGLRLCKELLKKGFEVTGIARSPKINDLTCTSGSGQLHMRYCDIAKENDLINLFNKIGSIDGAFHLAGQTYRRDSPGIHIYFRNNFLATLNLLECCFVACFIML